MTSLRDLFAQMQELDLAACKRREGALYLLVSYDEVVYVGQTTSLVPRIGLHLHGDQRSAVKEFDRVLWLRCAESDLDAYEGALIRLLRPRYSRRAPAWKGRDNEVLAALGLPLLDDEQANADEWQRLSYRPHGPMSERAKQIMALQRGKKAARRARVRAFAEAAS